MIKNLIVLGLIGALWITNPTLEDSLEFAEERVKAEQSTIRAGWSGVSKATGVNWLSKQGGLGNYSFCRKDLYLFSLYTVTSDKLLDSSKPIAAGLGIAGQVYGYRLPTENESGSILLQGIPPLFNLFNFTECGDFHKAGDLTGS